MTNEELAVSIRSDTNDRPARLLELWGQTRRIALKQVPRWASYHSNGVDAEDLEQSSFIALMQAVDTYDPTAGCAFSTWYQNFILKEFTIATGRRTEKQQSDLLNAAVSLDTPIADAGDGNLSLGDTVLDEQAEAAFTEAEDRVDNARLRTVLMDAVNQLPSEQRTAVVTKYWGGGRANARELNLAMRSLRHPRVSGKLKAFL